MEQKDSLAAAKALAVVHKKEIFAETGPHLTEAEVALLMRITAGEVEEMRREHRLLALDRPEGWFYPALQFDKDGGLIYRFSDVMSNFREYCGWWIIETVVGHDFPWKGVSLLWALHNKRDDVIDLIFRQYRGDGFS